MTTRRPTMNGATSARRGVVLMIVLGMMALFMVIIVSFVMTASSNKTGAKAALPADRQGDPPDALIKAAMYQVVRGPRNPASVIGPHALLEDIYGERESIVGVVWPLASNVPAVNPPITPSGSGNRGTIYAASGQQIIEFTGVWLGPDRQPGVAGKDDGGLAGADDVSETGAANSDDRPLDQVQLLGETTPTAGALPPSSFEGYYTGRVLTMLDGPAKNQSSRIIRWFLDTSTNPNLYKMWIRPFDNGVLPAQGDRFVINGRPFNGVGVGLLRQSTTAVNTGSQLLNMAEPYSGYNMEYALTPNPTDQAYREMLYGLLPAGAATIPDMDEDYDAPDFNNVLMAGLAWNSSSGWAVRAPSLHRPELVNYWMKSNRLGQVYSRWSQIPASKYMGARLRQKMILRPDPEDHVYTDQNNNHQWDAGEPWIDVNGNGRPDGGEWTDVNGNGKYDYSEPNWASNSSPAFDAINGPWDVDNDKDGFPDSIWVDLGFPVQTSTNGLQYKPLVAILCLDLDGRININAHGNATHFRYTAPTPPPVPARNIITDEANIVGATLYQTDLRSTPSGAASSYVVRTSPEPLLQNPTNGGGPFAGGLGWINHNQNSATWRNPTTGYTGSGVTTPLEPIGTGLGFSVCDINLAPVLQLYPTIWPSRGGNGLDVRRYNRYRYFLQGRAEITGGATLPNAGALTPGNQQALPVPGRYGEANLINTVRPGYPASYGVTAPQAGMTGRGNPSTNPLAYVNGDDNLPIGPCSVVKGPGAYQARGNLSEGSYDPRNTLLSSCLNIYLHDPSKSATASAGYNDYFGAPVTNSTYPQMGVYGGPSDVFGQAVVGLDFRGVPVPYAHQIPKQPSFQASNAAPVGFEAADEPWEIDLTIAAARRTWDYGSDGVPATSDDPSPTRVVDIDQPITPGELELILRGNDLDVQPVRERTWSFLDDLRHDPTFQRRVTSESWDLPCPNIIPTPEIREALRQYGLPTTNLTVADLLRGKMIAAARYAGLTVNMATLDKQVIAALNPIQPRQRLISPDLLLGLRMDLNRPLGDGMDNDLAYVNGPTAMPTLPSPAPANFVASYGYRVVDDPMEAKVGLERLWRNSWFDNNTAQGVTMDPTWDGIATKAATVTTPPNPVDAGGTIDPRVNEMFARQELAKHLYVLMMMVMDSTYLVPTNEPSLTLPQRQRLTAYRVAQWAINVVDFRDRDAIMTPFEFDIYPFLDNDATGASTSQIPGTWDVDSRLGYGSPDDQQASAANNVASGWRGVVWGMEYPELLITETVGLHDKRIADTDQEIDPAGPRPGAPPVRAGRTTDTGPGKKDPAYDQVRVPQGSAFIELYCTGRANWSPNVAAPSGVKVEQGIAVSVLSQLPGELYDTSTPQIDPVTAAVSYGALDLARMAPSSGGSIGPNPVWRIACSQRHLGRVSTSNQRVTVRERVMDADPANPNYAPDTTTMQPESMSILDPAGLNTALQTPLDRIVWMCNRAPLSTHPDYKNIYYGARAANHPVLLQPGHYAVVGPARPINSSQGEINPSGLAHVTRLGFTDGSLEKWIPQRISLGADVPNPSNSPYAPWVSVSTWQTAGPAVDNYKTLYNSAGANRQIQPPLGIPCGKNNAGGIPAFQGFNISEPKGGYQSIYAPRALTHHADGGATYDSLEGGVRDFPADYGDVRLGAANDMGRDKMLTPGTFLDFRTVFLQRLANPLLPWNPIVGDPSHQITLEVNPYITVDWTSMDLHIFNGQSVWLTEKVAAEPRTMPAFVAGGATQAPYPSPRNYCRTADNHYTLNFESRERGPRVEVPPNSLGLIGLTNYPGTGAVTSANYGTNAAVWPNNPPGTTAGPIGGITLNERPLWAAISDNPRIQPQLPLGAGGVASAPDGKFRYNLLHSLGYLNHTYGPWNSTNVLGTSAPWTSYGTGSSDQMGAGNYATTDRYLLDKHVGDPRRPFPWLAWNNRPYANAMELLLVPASSPSRFTTEFTFRTGAGDMNSLNVSTPVGALYRAGYYDTQARNKFWDMNEYACGYSPLWGTWYMPQAGAAGTQLASPVNMSHQPFPIPAQPVIVNGSGQISIPTTANPAINDGQPMPAITTTPAGNRPLGSPPYGHLLPFFASGTPTLPYNGGPNTLAPHHFRILEYVHVPSRFSGTKDMLTSPRKTPTASGNLNAFEAPDASVGRPVPDLSPYYIPFNYVSRYREPGKININTIMDRDTTTFQAIFNNFPDYQEMWGNLMLSRNYRDPRGYDMAWGKMGTNESDGFGGVNRVDDYAEWGTPGTDDVTSFNGVRFDGLPNELMLTPPLTGPGATAPRVVPSFMPNPFRAFTSNYDVPLDSLQYAKYWAVDPSGVNPPNMTPWGFVDASLMRRKDADNLYRTEPLFSYDAYYWNQWNPTSTVIQAQQAKATNEFRNGFRDTRQNPYFRYQPLIKTGNVFTTRSNVYAIWVTVGFFEVQRIPQTPLTVVTNPDGYKLVRELGSDTGEVKRYRGFAIFDRTIPVGFLRGENMNVDKAFLVKHMVD